MNYYDLTVRLSNPENPELGKADITFPIPGEEYDEVMKQLENMGIGDVMKQDCLVESLDGNYDILGALVGETVNVDELDYLAKRLASFDSGEEEKFNAACSALKVMDIKGFINATFCAPDCTVIADFKNLEKVGKDHVLTIHGCIPVEEFNQVSGKAVAQELIASGKGEPTPYGLFFRNSMEYRELYKGREFPDYLYEPGIFDVNLRWADGRELELSFPIAEIALERTLLRDGLSMAENPEMAIASSASDGNRFHCEHSDMDALKDWNELAKSLGSLNQKEQQKILVAAKELDVADITQLRTLYNCRDDFTFCPDVRDAYDYGHYKIVESDDYLYDENLEDFYNFEALGEELMEHEAGIMTEKGYLCCDIDSDLAELFENMNEPKIQPPEQKQAPKFEQQMGGM